MEGRELGRLTAGDVWRAHGSSGAIEGVLMDLNLDSSSRREPEETAGEAIKWRELMDK